MSKRILVVEDQEDLCGVLRDLLTGSGYAVIEAGDGKRPESQRPSPIAPGLRKSLMPPVIRVQYGRSTVGASW